jgi:RNA polymerase sigma-70 factor, ECF subfamily
VTDFTRAPGAPAAAIPSPKSSELAEQLARVALGDHAALRRVYEMSSSHLFGVALRILGRRDLSEEVMQDAFVNVWNHAGSYRAAQSQPMTWLISIVRNKALDVVRSAVIRRETEMPMDEDGEVRDIADERPQALELLTQAAQTMRIRECLAALDASPRQCLALAYYQGMSHAEVAEHMNAPLGTVKTWVRRGMERLKHCLGNAV